jgi:hypothetical protein
MKYLSVVSAADAALLLVGCDRAPNITGPAGSSTQPAYSLFSDHTNEMDVTWPAEIPNPCTDEIVSVLGTSHYIMTTSTDDNFGFHLSFNTISKGTGTGLLSGDSYKVSENSLHSVQVPDPTAVITDEEILHVLGSRSVENFEFHLISKLVVNGAGIPTVAFDRSYTKCTG